MLLPVCIMGSFREYKNLNLNFLVETADEILEFWEKNNIIFIFKKR